MGTNRRGLSRRGTTIGDSSAECWLRGDESCGFFKFKSQAELEPLWATHGDDASMFWRSRYCLPITREELEDHEDRWLISGEHGQYGGNNSYVDDQYTDDEKAVLWNERGDKRRYQWRPGMRRPVKLHD